MGEAVLSRLSTSIRMKFNICSTSIVGAYDDSSLATMADDLNVAFVCTSVSDWSTVDESTELVVVPMICLLRWQSTTTS